MTCSHSKPGRRPADAMVAMSFCTRHPPRSDSGSRVWPNLTSVSM